MDQGKLKVLDEGTAPVTSKLHTSINSMMVRCSWFRLSSLAVLLAVAHLTIGTWTPTTAPDVNFRATQNATLPDLYEASVVELQAGLNAGTFSSVDLVKAYILRIGEVNEQRAALHAVLEINPSAVTEAQILDEERKFFGPRGPLHGIPVLLKDNIATVFGEGLNTTAGSYSLLKSVVPRDAGVVTRLRKAGAIILGKANLSEFAHYRGNIASGWSGRGGQCTNAYFPAADPCGSSSGSGVAASIGLAAVTLGSETDGSITCPSAYNNIVGIKPTVGLTSRAGVIPISSHQDTVGPMTRSVGDAAAVLSVIAGLDTLDNYTSAAPRPIPDYTKALKTTALKGKRIGVPRAVFLDPEITGLTQAELDAFAGALKTIQGLGATVVDNADLPSGPEIVASNNETLVLNVDFKIELNAYYAGLVSNPSGVRDLSGLVAFDDAHKDLEEPTGYEDQSILLESQNTTGYDDAYYRALAFNHELGRTRGIDYVLKKYNLDALVLPSGGYTTTPAAIAGYPIVTVPLGFFPNGIAVGSAGPNTVWPAPGAPFGLSFLGTAWSEYTLVAFAYAYEQKTKTRLERRAYPAAVPLSQLGDVIGR